MQNSHQSLGTPHNTSLKLLTKEIYANACAIPSTCRGGGHGHLGLVMPVMEYVVIAGIAFQLPAHPGLVSMHAASANAATRQENIRLFDTTIKELSIATMVQEEIKKQLLIAVNCLYLAALDNDMFGFADVTVVAMVTHLHTNYGPITCAKLETNRASITTIWIPDNPIETLWERLQEIQCISITGSDTLTNNAIKDLTFIMFEATSMFTMACDTWCICPLATQTLIEFCKHFTSENKEQLHKLTMSQVGFHSAHAAFLKAPIMSVEATPKPGEWHPIRQFSLLVRDLSSPMMVSTCTTVGCMASVSTATTQAAPVSILQRGITPQPLSKTCKMATTPSCLTVAISQPKSDEEGSQKQTQPNLN